MFSLIGDSDAVVANLAWACRRECAVCLGEYAAGERIKVVPACAHGFHADCIDLWLAAKTTCPICRRDLSAGEAAEAEGVTDGEVAEGMGAEGMGAAAAPAEAAAEAAASPAAAAPAAETAVAANLVYSSSSSTASSSRRAAAAAAAVEMESDTVVFNNEDREEAEADSITTGNKNVTRMKRGPAHLELSTPGVPTA
ncbi:unnamed protein product [Closterium sp. NIES-53]